MSRRFDRVFWILSACAILVLQPLISAGLQRHDLFPVVKAQIDKPEEGEADEDVPLDEQDLLDEADDTLTSAEFNFVTTDSLEMLYDLTGNLNVAPEDQNALMNGQVDVRVTDYLLSLVLPEELGGYGLDHVRANRIFKNYTSEGAGKYDREGVGAVNDEDVISGHNRGQAVDVSEVGSITCKLTYKRHVGGSTTKWQKPVPVKVAWQSQEGIKDNPTPTSQSLLGSSADMSAQGIGGGGDIGPGISGDQAKNYRQ